MRDFLLASALFGFSLCTVWRKKIDDALPPTGRFIVEGIRTWFRPPQEEDEPLQLVTRLSAALRSGQSLDSALEEIGPAQTRVARILAGTPGDSALDIFLAGALRTGLPALSGLQAFTALLRAERKARRKSRATTAQSRAQAETLSWLPWVLALALIALDPQWALQAGGHGASWLCWAFALALTGLGRAWMRRMLDRALSPVNEVERMEEEVLPALVMELVARLANGEDAETAFERASAGRVRDFRSLTQLQSLVSRAARSGAPLREDLLSLLNDLHQQTETRWEERTQRLPVLMMAPLFLCFFPSSLLVVGSLLLPMMGELL